MQISHQYKKRIPTQLLMFKNEFYLPQKNDATQKAFFCYRDYETHRIKAAVNLKWNQLKLNFVILLPTAQNKSEYDEKLN